MKRKVFFRLGAFVIAMFIVAGAVYSSIYIGKRIQARTLAASTTSARGSCTMEVTTGRILYEKNGTEPMPMASTTKILTAITVLENCDDIDTPIEVDPRCIGIEGTSIYLQRGERLTVRELLLGMMLRSGNDASAALALYVRPTGEKTPHKEIFDEFSRLMNETAKKAGATNSSFKNPHGLDQEGHYTTARDLALITVYAIKNPLFAEIVATKEAKISGIEYPRVLRNKNRLLHSMPNCIGVKTGFTKKAGRCFVGAMTDNNMTVVCVVLNCGPMFEESATLMEMADEEFTMTPIIKKDQIIMCDDDIICGVAQEDFFYPLRNDEIIETEYIGDKVILKLDGEVIYTSNYNKV